MKIGTDGLVLGALAPCEGALQVLEVGTGTGVVSLMLAQRFPGIEITTLEIDEAAASEATQNVQGSPFSDRIEVTNTSFQSFLSDHQFDHIVSNPPFFQESLRSPRYQRSLARQDHGLSIFYLMDGGKRLLKPGGKMTIIWPYDRKEEFFDTAHDVALHPEQMTHLYTKPDREAKRIIVTLGHKETEMETNQLTVEDAFGEYSDDYKELLKDFLLIF
ncbi:tRNA1(Val) (adenine(37)-N6)-methyltransferase [Sanyastnella coralliicola]|uniref:tRNA1(Val) (adenine(37)-N6)-methyltransferase n=1 Tax=Sanyastnella coralliicola TaxID=3069118 RepID=UPI0027BA1CAB|nr:methyltransferase [Longitalea sp. SCSIO 12813]